MDGSQNEEGVTGAGYVQYHCPAEGGDLVEDVGHSFYIGKGHFTVFQSELYAIEQALLSIDFLYINAPDRQGETIIIHSDSKAVLLALTSNFVKSRQVLDIVDQLNHLGIIITSLFGG